MMIKVVKIRGKIKMEFVSRLQRTLLSLLVEGTNDLENVSFGPDEEPSPEVRDLTDDTSWKM